MEGKRGEKERKKERKRRPAMKNLFDASVQPEMKRLLFHLQVSGEIWKSLQIFSYSLNAELLIFFSF